MQDHTGEFGFIEWIRHEQQRRLPPEVTLGIGDDAAAWRLDADGDVLLATDMLLEGVHFDRSQATLSQIGRKALAVNLSDIAAMAGRPQAALVSVALPRGEGMQVGRELMSGLQLLADEFDVVIIGGDTNSWSGGIVISVTVVGKALAQAPVTRSGAQPGDSIFVTGPLGGSLTGHHLDFVPRVREAQALVELCTLHAMIDISDGLAADLHHLLDDSGVGAVLRAENIPIRDEAHRLPGDKSPLQRALGDGEDFELLFTVDAATGERLVTTDDPRFTLARIGEITRAEDGCTLIHNDGTVTTLPADGWQHGL